MERKIEARAERDPEFAEQLDSLREKVRRLQPSLSETIEGAATPEMARAAGRVTRYGAPGGSSAMQSNYAITCAGLHQRRIRRRGTAMSATQEDATPDER